MAIRREVLGSLFKTEWNAAEQLETLEKRLHDIIGMRELVATEHWKRYSDLINEQIDSHRAVIMDLAKNATEHSNEIQRRACIIEALMILMNIPTSIFESEQETISLYKKIKNAMNKLNPAKAG